jgi:threonine dehydrogenase-like Zn-dependent dehydrogenase
MDSWYRQNRQIACFKPKKKKGKTLIGLCLENKTLSLRTDLPVPEPGPAEALVRVRLAGICATDLQMIQGYVPFAGILGHEFVGEVIACPGAPEMVGRRVVGEINLSCGACGMCLRGMPMHCSQRRVLGIREKDGAFAEYLCIAERNLLAVADAVPDEAAVFAEPLAAALSVVQRAAIRPADRILVLGAGRLGQLIARVLALHGCALTVCARYKSQRQLLEAAGIEWIPENAVEPHGYDLVVEAGGGRDSLLQALEAVRPRGTIVLKTTVSGTVPVPLATAVVNEVTLVGSRCGPFAPALRLLKSGYIDPRDLIQYRFPLANGLEALKQAGRPGTMKVLLTAEK